ncbi:hypothetical protein RB195_020890 [Necator americanus]|uniref:Uncharacterized protein n=1 Tax=Necator americanus TaxID=51031 RepID=A0ABR1CM55_NECAM
MDPLVFLAQYMLESWRKELKLSEGASMATLEEMGVMELVVVVEEDQAECFGGDGVRVQPAGNVRVPMNQQRYNPWLLNVS